MITALLVAWWLMPWMILAEIVLWLGNGDRQAQVIAARRRVEAVRKMLDEMNGMEGSADSAWPLDPNYPRPLGATPSRPNASWRAEGPMYQLTIDDLIRTANGRASTVEE